MKQGKAQGGGNDIPKRWKMEPNNANFFDDIWDDLCFDKLL